MAKNVKENRMNTYISLMIFFLIMTLIPVIIVAFTGLKNFTSVYGIYSLTALGIAIYFSVIMGLFAWRNKIVYLILDLIGLIGGLTFMVISYVFSSYQGGLLLHLSCAFLLTYSVFRFGDAKQKDNYIFRFFMPFIYLLGGLVFVLWFINVKIHISVHIIFASIANFIAILFLIPSLVTSIKKGDDFYYDMQVSELEYVDTTDEWDAKRAEKKEQKEAEKAKIKEEKEEIKKGKESFEEQKQEHYKEDATWIANVNDINYAKRHITDKFNGTLKLINDEYEHQRFLCKNGYGEEGDYYTLKYLNEEAKSFRKEYKKIMKHIDWIAKQQFKGKDQYKIFQYNPSSGSLRKKKSDERTPTFFIKGMTISRTLRKSDLHVYVYYSVKFDPEEIRMERIK